MPFTGGSYSRTKTFANSGSLLPADLNSIQDDIGGQLNTALIRTGVSDSSVIRRGKSVIPTNETRINVAYGLLTTPDQVTGIVLPTDGRLCMHYRALWKINGGGTSEATIFIGANQLKTLAVNAAPVVVTQSLGVAADQYSSLYTHNLFGLATDESNSVDTSLVTTGFIISGAAGQGDHDLSIEGLPAGTYTVNVQFKTNGTGTVSVKERKLMVWTTGF